MSTMHATQTNTPALEHKFYALYRDYRSRIYNYALRFLGNAQEAEEMTQDIFIKAHKALDRFDGNQAQLKAWIYRIAYTTLVNRSKTPWWKLRYKKDAIEDMPLKAIHSNPEAISSHQQQAQHVQKSLKKMKSQERAALLMFVNEGLSQSEIAKSMKLKENHVKVLIHRARSFLRQEIEGALA